MRSIPTSLGIAALLLLSGCTVGRFFLYNFPDARDYRKFPSRPLAAPSAQPYAVNTVAKAPRSVTVGGRDIGFEDYLQQNRTVAFLVVHHDTIVYEKYFKGYDAAHVHPSFSMAKSITSILIGCAVADGYIRDVHQPVTDLVPELKANGFDRVTIEHVLQMTAGLDLTESYTNPFGDDAQLYYGRRLYKRMAKLKLKRPPGKEWEYVSGDTQLLGLILERAIRSNGDTTRTITSYLQEKLWTPLGMEYPASWSIDRKQGGMEKTFCCVNAPARDFAKIGSLYLHKGRWNGQQLVPESWVAQSTAIDTTNGSARFYQYQWWIPSPEGDFMAQGILGQYIYVDPARDVVIVRLGMKEGHANWTELFRSMARVYQ